MSVPLRTRVERAVDVIEEDHLRRRHHAAVDDPFAAFEGLQRREDAEGEECSFATCAAGCAARP
ncbi:MAG: hypothetical protein U0326_12315 [Polyangiales bacterium]